MMGLSRRVKGLIIVVLVVVFIWVGMRILSAILLGPRPPRPAITRSEFDFRLEYELDGERIVVEDTIIALFDGFSADSGSMAWFRTWRLHLASDRRAQHLLLRELEDGRRIYYGLGAAGYYMGESGSRELGIWTPFNAPILVETSGSPTGSHSSVGGPEGLYNDFGIRLISWEHDPPIENSFE